MEYLRENTPGIIQIADAGRYAGYNVNRRSEGLKEECNGAASQMVRWRKLGLVEYDGKRHTGYILKWVSPDGVSTKPDEPEVVVIPSPVLSYRHSMNLEAIDASHAT